MAAETRPSIRFLPRTRSSSRLTCEIRLDLIFSTPFASLFCLSIRRHWISRRKILSCQGLTQKQSETLPIVCTCCMPWHVLTSLGRQWRHCVKDFAIGPCNVCLICLHLPWQCLSHLVGRKWNCGRILKCELNLKARTVRNPGFWMFTMDLNYCQFSLQTRSQPATCTVVHWLVHQYHWYSPGRGARSGVQGLGFLATEDRAAKRVRYHGCLDMSWFFRTCDCTDTNKSIYNKSNRRMNYRINMWHVYIYIYRDWNHFNPVTWDDFGFLYVCKWFQVTFL